jgi:hypothetical protein
VGSALGGLEFTFAKAIALAFNEQEIDLNDYSIPPAAVGRPVTLVDNTETVRLLDGPTVL